MSGPISGIPISRYGLAKSGKLTLVRELDPATSSPATTMPKTLIIAEKPSVMTDLSKALAGPLGRFEAVGTGRDRYFENDRALITSAVGHLVGLKMPMGPNGRQLPWRFDVLPVAGHFELDPIPESEARLKQVLKLAKRKDVDLIVNACDAGREGELIFRYIMDFGGVRKPVKRLWMQSMTQRAITEAWGKLRDEEQMRPLVDAARCRSESDWLVGLNATRALTCFNSRFGGFNITSAGRVQTPTLAILATREAEIAAFRAKTYFEVHAEFEVSAGIYPARWVRDPWKKDAADPDSRAERIWDAAEASTIAERCRDKQGVVEETRKAQSQIAPQLYDLTTLQREAPFSAKGTLSIAQALYEKHKVITYPRTDSRCLPEDTLDQVRETLGEIANSGRPAAEFARAVLQGKEDKGPKLVKSRRIFDDSKVSDHFAIIPTGRMAKLSDTEQKLYDMIVNRFIAVFYPPAEFEQTTRLTRIAHPDVVDTFRTEGRVLVKPGWLEVYGRRPGVAAGKDELVAAEAGAKALAVAMEVREESTKPPARYTESTLLSAMEGAGKLIDDEALAGAMAERGLGTPATRATTIETLLSQKYIVREGRDLIVTPSGMRLIDLVRRMDIEGLSSPKLTGDWEYKLRRMEQGELSRERFMADIESYSGEIVAKAKHLAETLRNVDFPDLAMACPVCGAASLRQTEDAYECRAEGCKFKLKKQIAGRPLSQDEIATLLTTGFVGPLTGFRSRFNSPFDAGLKFDEKWKVTFAFENDEESGAVELDDSNLLAELTLSDGRMVKVHKTDRAFHIPALASKKEPKGVRIGKTILKRELDQEQILKMLATGKSDLIKGFISNRTRRPFDAFLTFDPATGKIGFEYPPRPPRPATKGAKPAKKRTDGA